MQGVYAYIVNDAASEAYSGSHSFQYGLASIHFDEVNLYYHIDRFRQEFIANLDDGSLDFTRITAHAHTPIQDLNGDGILDPNAWFNRGTQALYFNDEHALAGTRDFAKEDKVVYHEYSHAVIYDVESGIRSERSEEGAISEGVADYFAGAHSGRSIILDYAAPFAIRNMENPGIDHHDDLSTDLITGEVNEAAHIGGEFFSAILWDLRGRMSATEADFLAYDALFRVTSNPDFLAFRDAMMTADDAAYGGANNGTIEDTFADWGVVTPLEVSISGVSFIDPGEEGTWTANAQHGYGAGSYSYQWHYRDNPNDSWQQAGSTSSSFSHTFYNNTPAIMSARVRVRVTSGGETVTETKSVKVYAECADPNDNFCT